MRTPSSKRYVVGCEQCRRKRVVTRSDFRPVCPQCTAANYGRRRYRLQRAHVLSLAKKYRRKHRHKIIAKLRAYRSKHRRSLNLQRRAWGKAHPQYARKYYLAHVKEYAACRKRWRKKNPERWLLSKRHHERLRVARANQCRVGRIDYALIWKRDRGVCGICKRKVRSRTDAHFDHIIPLALKGPHTAANIQVAHARCNMRKGWRLAA